MNCDEVEELSGAYAFGAVTKDEHTAIAGHLSTCAKHPEIAQLQAAAASLALAADEIEPPTALKSRLMAAVAQSARAPAAPPIAPRESAASRFRAWFSGPRLGYGLSIALAIAVVGLLAWNVSLQGGSSGQTVLNVTGSGTGQVIYLRDQHLAVMDVHGLARLPSDKVYEVWAMSSGRAVRLGALDITDNGTASASLPLDSTGVESIAVTVEQAPGVDQPTTSPVLSAAFS